jgi:hypothetical protein
MKKLVSAMFALVIMFPHSLLARGGGGGSGGGAGSWFGTFVFLAIILIGTILTSVIATREFKKRAAKAQKAIQDAEAQDLAWDESKLITYVRQTFIQFQNDWSSFNVDSMKSYLTEAYWKRMVLEMNVLKNEHRQNLVENARPSRLTIIDVSDSPDNAKDCFTVQVEARADDVLRDTEASKDLYVDSDPFTEYWDFVREGDEWKLSLIRQVTENVTLREPAIEAFAKRNNFFYDADFGWLMMPNKGVIFDQTNFKTSDINNHVIGYYRDKIVEFYTFIPVKDGRNNYVVAQVALPISYKDILLRRRRKFFNFSPSGLRRVHTESNDFERKFCLWAHREDQTTSFELLTPNFMEKVYDLPFELNIEVVGPFLYLYAKSRQDINYDQMLEILSWAFDEMKM